jgi:hypothetical protein
MWTYRQSTGELLHDGGVIAHGYSGHGPGKNNPAMQGVPNIGPIPAGTYRIGKPFKDPFKGPFCLWLVANGDNEMFGRAGFLIHGDSMLHPGEASNGCIVLGREIREKIARGKDWELEVTA